MTTARSALVVKLSVLKLYPRTLYEMVNMSIKTQSAFLNSMQHFKLILDRNPLYCERNARGRCFFVMRPSVGCEEERELWARRLM